jgi:ferrochelatase
MSDLIEQELRSKTFEMAGSKREHVNIFFSAHGVPLTYVTEAGDPYKKEMEECISLIMGELRSRGVENPYTLAYQSRVGPVEWLKPYTEDAIRVLTTQGCKSILAVPVSFVSEHIETLEEIDMEYRGVAAETGIRQWGRVPALNMNQVFIDDLALAVMEALPYVGTATPASKSVQVCVAVV